MEVKSFKMDYKEIKKSLEEIKGSIKGIMGKLDKITTSLPNITPPTEQPKDTNELVHFIGKYNIAGKVYHLRQSHKKIDPSKPVVFIDEGHGGLDENGEYTTPARNGKRYQHIPSIVNGGMDKEKTGWIYEGVLNRWLVEEMCKAMKDESILSEGEIQYIIISDDVLDIPLKERVEIINFLYQIYDKGFLISVHCNAFKGESTGSCLFTTRHQSTSDIIAQHLAPYLYDLENHWSDKGFWVRDGSGKVNEIDYEKNFAILMCNPPAVMTEVLFFDNAKDVSMLLNKSFRIGFMERLVLGLESFIQFPTDPRQLPKK